MPDEDNDGKMPLMAHLEELRNRLIVCFIAAGIGFAISYGFKEKLFDILMKPLISVMGTGETLIYTGLAEAFFTYLKVSALSGLMLASPVILYEFWMFVSPGLYKKEKHILLPIISLSTVFFVGGALFGYFIVFPLGFKFFLGFATETIRPLPSMKEYLSFSASMLIAFGVVFELPLVMIFMVRMGLISIDFLKKQRKYAILIFFIVGAILTPPDVVSQIMMAVPLMILYEISILGAMLFSKKKGEDDVETEDVTKTETTDNVGPEPENKSIEPSADAVDNIPSPDGTESGDHRVDLPLEKNEFKTIKDKNGNEDIEKDPLNY